MYFFNQVLVDEQPTAPRATKVLNSLKNLYIFLIDLEIMAET